MNIGEITVKINMDLSDEGKEAIRQIVREEIAAQRERPITVEINNGKTKRKSSESLRKTLIR